MRPNLNTLTLKNRIDTCHQQVKIIYRGDYSFHAQKHFVKHAIFFTFSSIPKFQCQFFEVSFALALMLII